MSRNGLGTESTRFVELRTSSGIRKGLRYQLFLGNRWNKKEPLKFRVEELCVCGKGKNIIRTQLK